MESFSEWLAAELSKRNWRQADLVRESGLSRGAISNFINGHKEPGERACFFITDALGISPIEVCRVAGIVPELGEEGRKSLEDLVERASRLRTESLEDVKDFIEYVAIRDSRTEYKVDGEAAEESPSTGDGESEA